MAGQRMATAGQVLICRLDKVYFFLAGLAAGFAAGFAAGLAAGFAGVLAILGRPEKLQAWRPESLLIKGHAPEQLQNLTSIMAKIGQQKVMS